jgi:hypothetical protein
MLYDIYWRGELGAARFSTPNVGTALHAERYLAIP